MQIREFELLYDLECSMSRACWLLCCCWNNVRQKPHIGACLSVRCRSSIKREKCKAHVHAFPSGFISSASRSFVWLSQANNTKKTPYINCTKVSQNEQNTKAKAGFWLWDPEMCRHVTLNQKRLKNIKFQSSMDTHLKGIAVSWSSRHGNDGGRRAVSGCNYEYEYMGSLWLLSQRSWTVNARMAASEWTLQIGNLWCGERSKPLWRHTTPGDAEEPTPAACGAGLS